MLLYLFRRFIKVIFYPLINDAKVSIDKKGHKIRSLFIACFPWRYQIFKRMHNDRNKMILIEHRKQIPAVIYKFCQIRLFSMSVIFVPVRILLPLIFYLKMKHFLFAVFVFKIPVKSSPADAGFPADRVYINCIKVLGFHQLNQRIRKT